MLFHERVGERFSGDESARHKSSIPHDKFGNFNSKLSRSTQDLKDGPTTASRGIRWAEGGRR
jgi:hypothetical protein